MKKFLSLVLTLVMVMSLSVTAFAEDGTTTLTVEVPNAAEPSYTLHIPANTTLTYGSTEKQEVSGHLYMEDVQNAKAIKYLAPYTDLMNTSDSSDKIALRLYANAPHYASMRPVDQATGQIEESSGLKTDTIYEKYGELGWYPAVRFYAEVSDWSGATPGATYQAVITFTVWAE